MKHKKKRDRPVVRLKPSAYQPTKADKEEFVPPEDMTPEELAKRMFTQIRIVRDLKA